jgi:MarR family transcriptional regulator, transcriptional regulator for hemolysin
MGVNATAIVERAAHLVGVYLDPVATALRITQGEAHVLAHLARHGPTAIAALHREFGHKRSTLTNIIDRLEGRKLVRRQLNPGDRRSFVVSLTAGGKRTARKVTEALDDLERDLAALVAERDLAGVVAVTLALQTLVEQQYSA